MLLGRTTFEEMRGFWPHQTDDTTGVSDHLDRVQKYVVSTTMDDPEWQNSTVCAVSTRCASCAIGRSSRSPAA